MNEVFEGLSSSNAKKILAKYGFNELVSQNKKSIYLIFLDQFKNILVILLLIAAFISALVGEMIDAVIIVLILILNAVLGFIQEFKAENAIESLKIITTTKTRVIRDGKEQLLDSKLLVPGDIVFIAEGDKIPADGKIRASVRLEVNEASLTGESLPVSKSEKDTQYANVYMGTIVSSGRATIEIVHTGNLTKFGAIASSLVQIKKTDTPLNQKISKLALQLSIGAFILTVLLFIIGLFQKREIIEMLLINISLLVAAVPEGLPAVITITLAIGLQRMARQKAILRKLGAMEALGNTTYIATDKTGTLTENKMKAVEVWLNNTYFSIPELKNKIKDRSAKEFIKCGVICNNAKIASSNDKDYIIGDQTEGSLLTLAQHVSIDPDTILLKGKLLDEFGFDSILKMMSVVWQDKKSITLYSKGAPEQMLNISTHIYLNGKNKKLTKSDRDEISLAIEKLAKNGLRVLALAKRDLKKARSSRKDAEKDLTLIGLVGIADPPRKDVREVIEQTTAAGITTIMITGDNPLTASYIARETGIINKEDSIITGNDLADMDNKTLEQTLMNRCVFARTSPQNKLRIVKTLQKMGHIVTVTGDGVNDVLALKQADIGVAMGVTGTDVAKEVADMVITDDNFVSIVNAIREGRIIYENIVNSITYLVSCNIGEMMMIFTAIALGYPAPLLPVQILWVNLVTDGLPALSLAFDSGSASIMNKQNLNSQKRILNINNIPKILAYGIIVACVPLSTYLVTLSLFGIDTARSISFTVLVLMQMMIIFFLRPNHSFYSNKILLLTVGLSLGLQYLITTIPIFKVIFHVF